MKEITEQKCLYCGMKFETANKNRLFCSHYCSVISNNEQIEIQKKKDLQDRICAFCNKKFTSTNNKHIYCSAGCRVKAYRKRTRKK